jgi:hypothetical protein
MKLASRFGRSMVVVAVIFTMGAILQPAVADAATSPNLILNPGAEAGTGSSTGAVVPVPDWTELTGTGFTAVKYGATGGGFPTSTSPGPPHRGLNFFAGGPDNDNDVAVQSINLSTYVGAIKSGTATYDLSGWIGGSGTLNAS